MNVKRARYFRAARIAVLVLVVAFFLLPYDVRSWFPVWLLFLAALALEADFFIGGWLQARREARGRARRRTAGRSSGICPISGAGATGIPASPRLRVVVDPGFRWIHVVEAVGVLAVIAVLLYAASRPRGWDAVSAKRQAQTEAVLSDEARQDRAPSRVGHVRRQGRVRRLRPGRGRAGRGRRRPGVPDARDLRHALPARDQAPRAVVPAGGAARSRCSRTRHGTYGARRTRVSPTATGSRAGSRSGRTSASSESRARAMMREQLATNAADSGSNSQYRVPSGCRNGGPSDLRQTEPRFP